MIEFEAKPFPFSFDFRKTALVFIDMQRDFLEIGGFGSALGNDVSILHDAITPCKALLELGRFLNVEIVHTLECHLPDLSDCPPSKLKHGKSGLKIGDQGPFGRILVRGEPGNQIIEALQPKDGEIVIHKPGKGAFYNTSLGNELKNKGIECLIFTGVTTEVCVQTSMREATDRGFVSLCIEDATGSYFPEFKKAALSMFASQGGIVGHTSESGQFLSALWLAAKSERWTGLPLKPGVTKLTLQNYSDGSEIAILKYEPGAKVPRHRHDGVETIWVLEGSQGDESGLYTSGKKIVNSIGTEHAVYSDTGCFVLIHWEKPVVFV